MSFPVALQSAVFYLLACTPCLKWRHRHRAKQAAKENRLKRANLEMEQPGVYQHPEPFTTNPYWQEEINRGPSLPKKSSSKNSSNRGLTSAGRDSNVSEQTNVDDSRTNVDSMSVLREDDEVPSNWNRKIGYQREDEELWGVWSSQRVRDAFAKARGSAGHLIESTLGLEKEVTDQQRQAFYTTPRNPPVNDFHPPIITTRPTHKDGIKWMLQPPPPAKVMEGKVPVRRAGSSASKSSGRTLVSEDPFLDKLVRERLAEERARKKAAAAGPAPLSALPTEAELIKSLFTPACDKKFTTAKADDNDKPTESTSAAGDTKLKAPAATVASDESDDDWLYEDNEEEDFIFTQLRKRWNFGSDRHIEFVPFDDDVPDCALSRELAQRSKKMMSRRTRLLAAVGTPEDNHSE
ncbi:hypothetical protein ISF_00216 [Cordyceps fumosorosea ARSEF 2679]|uniref:Signal peptide-containing protein n=1 Tax=Cordyceps fumosorosea (strain ARSEF 2679) TaxID=1081104 RepID=A0A168E2Y5_CORFA|nr:hypothetical protein ISF_00216 [Cordyceps fumosorosea ARSEF 2679]OAA73315.1 hypothetical protein ISF_00216 [Cordyceps fumosorosea ARSEF 2679]